MDREPQQPQRTRHILIVDLDSSLESRVRKLLNQTQFVYHTVTSSTELELLLQERLWDLIVCNHTLAPLKMTEMVRLTLHRQPQTPVIVVGEQITPREAFELGRLGVQELIETSDTQRLLTCIQQALHPTAPSAEDSATEAAASSPAQQLRLILDSMQDAIMSISLPDHRLIFVSSSYERVFGYPVENFLQDRNFYKQVVHPEELELATAALKAVWRDGYIETDHRVIWRNGEVHWLHRRTWINYDAQGNPIQLIDMARDITARKQAQRALESANRKQRAILESMPDLMFHVRADGTILDYHFHSSISDVVLPPEVFLGKNVSDFINSPLIPFGVVQQAADAIQRAAILQQPIIFEYMMPNQRYYEARMLPIEASDELIIMSRDITERKLHEAELRESEETYRLLFRNNPFPMWVYDRETLAFLEVNEAAVEKYGYSQEEFLCLTLRDIRPAADLARLDDDLGQVRPELQHSGLWRHRLKSGQVIDVEITSHTLDYAGRRGVLVLAQDISARQQAERELRASEERLRLFIEHAPVAIAMFDHEMRYLAVTHRWLADYHLSTTDVVSLSHYQVFPEIPDRWRAAHERGLHGEVQSVEEDEFKRLDGSTQWLRWAIHPWYTADGAIGGIIIFTEDITERKLVNAKLRESQEKYRSLLESSDSVIAMFDEHGTVLYANEAAALPYAFTAQQMIGKAYHELFPPEIAETQLANIRAVIRNDSGLVREARSVVAGEEHWYRTSIQPVRDSMGAVNAALINATDITVSKTAEAALRRSAESLQQQKSFLEILLTISSRFITLPADKLDTVIGTTLEEIGTFLNADRLYIFEYDFERGIATNTFEWCADGIQPEIMNLQAVPVSGMEEWVAILRRGDTIQIACVQDRDPEDAIRKLLEPQRIQSLLAIPMMDEGVCIGFIGLDAVRAPRTYGESDQQLLQLFAHLLVNIYGRMNTLKALEASEKRYRQIVETAQEGIWLIDLDGRTVYLNQRMADMLGFTPEEVLGADFFSFMDEEARPQAAYDLERRQQGLQAQRDFRFNRKDGSALWVIINMTPVSDDSHKLVGVLGMLTDITERKLAEDALLRSEAYLRSLINSETTFNIRVDMQGTISYCNERYRRQFAWAAPSLIGMNPLDLVHPDDQVKVYDAVKKCLADADRTAQIELRKRTESGDHIWTLWEFSAVAGSDGSVQEIHCVGFDITKQKEAEAALQETNRMLEQRIQERTAELQEERSLLRTVIDAIPDFIYVKDRRHRMVLNNLAHIQSIGMESGAEMIGKTDLDLYPNAQAAQFHETEDRLFASEQAIINLEEHSIRPDGSDVWMLTTKVPLRSVQGTLIGLVGITRDITAIKSASEALRFSEERYRTTVAAMSEGLVVHGRDGAIELCNTAAERILGLTTEQMIGRTSIDPRWRAIHEDGSPFPGETHPAMVTLRTGVPQSNIIMGVHKPDDTLTWILVNSQSLINPADQQPFAVVATFADITAPKQAEAAIKAALAHEKELGELKSRFVSMASHEFRTPLASILAATETLTLYWERMDKAKIDERLKRIGEQVARMTEIMEDVLQLTRMHTGRTKFEPAPGDLDGLIVRVVSDLAELPDYHDRIYYERSSQPLNAVFDARLLHQVISNLLHNALKYSPPETNVLMTVANVDGYITLRIVDEGIGIPPEDLKHLFEPFHRAANVGDISGTGLGLAIAKEAVELHGGTVAVESQVEVGTTFIVTLPDYPQDAS